MRETDKIKLSKEKREDMINSIKEYFYTERDEELGDLASSHIFGTIKKITSQSASIFSIPRQQIDLIDPL